VSLGTMAKLTHT